MQVIDKDTPIVIEDLEHFINHLKDVPLTNSQAAKIPPRTPLQKVTDHPMIAELMFPVTPSTEKLSEPFKKTEIALTCSVACKYWKELHEYYHWPLQSILSR